MLFIEYDVNTDGEIELVALINATEEEGLDPDGEAWMNWRRAHEDMGMGCVGVSPTDLKAMESALEPDELRAVVERIVLSDRAGKEEVTS